MEHVLPGRTKDAVNSRLKTTLRLRGRQEVGQVRPERIQGEQHLPYGTGESGSTQVDTDRPVPSGELTAARAGLKTVKCCEHLPHRVRLRGNTDASEIDLGEVNTEHATPLESLLVCTQPQECVPADACVPRFRKANWPQ